MILSSKHMEFLKKIGVNIDFSKELDDSICEQITECVSEYLQVHGFDENYRPTKHGEICEEILDILQQ